MLSVRCQTIEPYALAVKDWCQILRLRSLAFEHPPSRAAKTAIVATAIFAKTCFAETFAPLIPVVSTMNDAKTEFVNQSAEKTTIAETVRFAKESNALWVAELTRDVRLTNRA